MNRILLHPTDLLFFRDGRPMGGSLSGHGAAWPLPTVTNAALHAALHRAGLEGVHRHRRGRSGSYSEKEGHRDRKFGGLLTAGPFPVLGGEWYFPRPLDAGESQSRAATLLPLEIMFEKGTSSLPEPLIHAVANTEPPSKSTPAPWWSRGAWERYLGHASPEGDDFEKSDTDFSDTESAFGIGVDPRTGTQDGERFYSAHYLRLRDEARLGLLASALDKTDGEPGKREDLLATLLPNHGTSTPVIVGGQQRICTARRDSLGGKALPLPRGRVDGFPGLQNAGGETWYHVKWTLLSPAVFPAIGEHPGGWLPSWVDPGGQVRLLDGPGKNYVKRHGGREGAPIEASLVAAVTGKPIPVTGYATGESAEDCEGLEHRETGPKPLLLAVPAGSVYYFQTKTAETAAKLAVALNWHGDTPGTEIRNRRSTSFGEKGFGLGVCGPWSWHPGQRPDSHSTK